MPFLTYENDKKRPGDKKPRVVIHVGDCRQVRKNGGHHEYDQGRYSEEFATYRDAETYAKELARRRGRLVVCCSFCKPERVAQTQ